MSLVLIAELRPHPGQTDEVMRALSAMIEPSMAEPGCLGYRPLADSAGSVVCLEEWEDEEALQFHFTTEHFKTIAALLDDLLAEPFQLRRLQPIPE